MASGLASCAVRALIHGKFVARRGQGSVVGQIHPDLEGEVGWCEINSGRVSGGWELGQGGVIGNKIREAKGRYHPGKAENLGSSDRTREA